MSSHASSTASLAGPGPSAPKKRKANPGGASNGNNNTHSGHEAGITTTAADGVSSANVVGSNTVNNDEGAAGVKPKRTPSCDLCRARKVKCVKNEGQARCDGCVGLNQRCEYTHERKKPGPANGFAKKPTPPPPAQRLASYEHPYTLEHHRAYSDGLLPPPNLPTTASQSFSADPQSSLFSGPGPAFDNPFSLDHTDWSSFPGSSAHQGDLPFLPISPNTLLHPVAGEIESSNGSPAGPWPWSSSGWDMPDPTNQFAFSAGGWDPGPSTNQSGSTGPPVDRPSTSEGIRSGSISGTGQGHLTGKARDKAVQQAAVRGVQRLEEVLEWSTMMRILHAYHAHLYPLLPIVHWPSFSQQLIAREDERSDHWRAFLLSLGEHIPSKLMAYSIIQLPRSSLTFIPVPELRRIHQRCHAESRKLQNRKYTKVALVDVTTLYCQHIYLGTLGRTHAANLTLAEAIYLARILGLHDERLPRGTFDVVEREMRRRTFWLLYGSDRTISALTSDCMQISDADLCLPSPLCLDDNLVTPSGAFPQPPGTTPVLAGFHFNTRLFRLLGEVLTLNRIMTAPSGSPNNPFPILHLPPMHPPRRPAQHFWEELERILSELPGPLQIFNPNGGEPTPNGSVEGEVSTKDLAAFGTCRANLLVTQALIRFAIRQYAKVCGEPDAGEPGREWAEKDVLHLLESMSPESLAANGDSLRAKVLFVASSLLEKYPSTTEGHSYVTDFLAVYTRISQEQHVSLLEPERSGEVSRELTPLGV